MTTVDVDDPRARSAGEPPDHHVVIIGAGPGGVAAAVVLRQAGIEDFVLLERKDRLGGTWRDNTYPGVGVDIPSMFYQYSFARTGNWTRVFAKGDEVNAYHVEVAERLGIVPHVRFGTEVVRETWDEAEHLWRLHTADGRIVTARFVLTAVGAFIRPKTDVGIPGLKRFEGRLQRPDTWDHTYDHSGKRVAIIGTGASSVQITPAIAPQVDRLTVFQRTPVWCLPKPDFVVPARMQRVLGIGWVGALVHALALGSMHLPLRIITRTPLVLADPMQRIVDAVCKLTYRTYLRAVVDDPADRSALTPGYGLFAKRPTMSNSFLQAFNRDNVQLVTSPIAAFTPRGLRTIDGVEHEFDMIVLATGYEVFSDPETYRTGAVLGSDGFDLATFYAQEGLQSYESVSLPRLPNRWTLAGPYSWTGTGWHELIEVAARHAARVIAHAHARGATRVAVRQEAHERYHAKVRRYGRNMKHYFNVVNRGLNTYYLNSQGDTPFIRPSTPIAARRSSETFPLDDYEYVSGPVTSRSRARATDPVSV